MDEIITSNCSFFVRKDSNTVYVQGVINNKRYKKNIKKKGTPIILKWLKSQNPERMLLELVGLNNIKDSVVTLQEFGYKYLKATSSNRGKESQADYLRCFNLAILPYFENFKWNEIKSLDLINFFNVIENKYAYDRAKRTKNILSNIIETAFDEDLIPKNPFSAKVVRKHFFSKKVVKTQAYSVEESKLLLENSEGWYKVFLELALKYGLRVGELMGLKWSDFDIDRGFFKIQRNITKGEITESSKQIHTNKNHLREIFMFPETINIIKEYKNFRPDTEWMFVNKYGKPFMQSQSIANNHLKPLCKRLGIEYKTNYATRRTFISIMRQSQKIDLSEIQEVVGHKEGSDITDKHYNLDVLGDAQKQENAKNRGNVFNKILDFSYK